MRAASTWAAVAVLGLWLAGCSSGNTEVPDGDAGVEDAGVDAGEDAGLDAGADADEDAGADAGEDAGADAGEDGGDGGPAEIWRPALGTRWQWQIDGKDIDTSFDVEMYDIDLFEAPQATIDALHAAGRVVICYFSAGSREDWRPDADQFPAEAVGAQLEGWPGENWVDVRLESVRTIMAARLELAVSKRCDGLEPDNVNAWENQGGGLGISAADQLAYNRWLAAEAHARGLSVGLKCDAAQAEELEPDFDWTLNEECLTWDECGELLPFLQAGKAVFHVEYVDAEGDGAARASEVCPDSARAGFSTLIKLWDLTAWRIECPYLPWP